MKLYLVTLDDKNYYVEADGLTEALEIFEDAMLNLCRAEGLEWDGEPDSVFVVNGELIR